jgi:hypothetical protein
MPALNTKNLAPTPMQVPHLHPRRSVVREWRLLPIVWLENFERVTDQFAAFGVGFADAIAVRPSNPRFSPATNAIQVMPCNRRKSIKMSLSRPVTQLQLSLMGSTPITVSAFNAEGHCVALAETATPVLSEHQPHYPEQTLTLDTKTAAFICLESKVPFMLTRLAFKRP